MKLFLPIATIAALGLAGAQLQAATISDTGSIAFFDANWDTNSPPPNPIELDLFDDLGGTRTLVKVTIVASARARGQTTMQNFSDQSQTTFGANSDSVSADVDVTSTVGGVSIALNPIAGDNIGTHIIGPTPNSPVVVDIGGGIAGAGTEDSDTVTYTSATDLAAFINPGGTFTLRYEANESTIVSTSGGAGVVGSQIQASGEATVTYEYTTQDTPVPAPGALLLLGTGLIGMVAARRRRALK